MMQIAEPFRAMFEQIGFSPEMIFSSPQIKPWRTLSDRENCTWDLPSPGGASIRLHVKRYPAPGAAGKNSPADEEAAGYRALQSRGIPTVDLAAWGTLADGRSFIATVDLSGFTPADKLIESGVPFEKLLAPTASLAAKLHAAGLHHRDLYLCHFLARADAEPMELRLIDAARVRDLPGVLTRRRWIVKDLAQFWFSTTSLAITDEQRDRWLENYARAMEIGGIDRLRRAIIRKSGAIARHDLKLRRAQPNRNVSIPR